MQKAASDLEPALHPTGKCFDVIIFTLPKLEEVEQHFDTLVPDLSRDMVKHTVQLHVFIGRQLLVEAWVLKDNTKTFASFIRLPRRVKSVDLDPAARRL